MLLSQSGQLGRVVFLGVRICNIFYLGAVILKLSTANRSCIKLKSYQRIDLGTACISVFQRP
jgi:hypothetical protein